MLPFNQNKKTSLTLDYNFFVDKVHEQIEIIDRPAFEPTGIQEDIIFACGCGNFDIIFVSDPNKIGKTGTGANIIKNIYWQCDEKWFAFWEGLSIFKNWPYKDKEGNIIKNGRISGTVKNTADSGPIQTEIKKWWPANKYTSHKAYKSYASEYDVFSDDGNKYHFDVLTYQQSADEFEGPLHGWHWSDEPPKPSLVGPIWSRFMHGGIWVITATPLRCGAFLDVLDDLREKGARIRQLSHDISENSSDTGKPNHKGTKRGLMTDMEIKHYSSGIPENERAARLEGKADHKSGKVYPMFNMSVHAIDIDFDYLARFGNGYMALDPHSKYYPFCIWLALLKKGNEFRYIVYNEFPTYEMLGGYYDEKRKTVQCNWTLLQLAEAFKALDMSNIGMKIYGRFIDTRYAKGAGGRNLMTKTDGVVEQFSRPENGGLVFQLPNESLITSMRDMVRSVLYYDPQRVVNEFNEPSLLIGSHCRNVLRSVERHHTEDDGEAETETYKDPSDTLKILFAGINGKDWVNPVQKPIQKPIQNTNRFPGTWQELSKELEDVPGMA